MLFKIVGSWVRGLYLIGLGGFWLAIAYYLSGFGQLTPKPTVVGLTVIGSLTFGAGLVVFIRGLMLVSQRAPLPEGAAGWRDDGDKSASDGGFDPDAAIARYLERRVEPAATAPEPESPPRPAFGRKRV